MTTLENGARSVIVTDSRGRQLTLRTLTVLDRLRLFKAAGPILAENNPWFGMAILASSVAEIDRATSRKSSQPSRG